MVEQFNLRSSKNVDSQQRLSTRDVTITAPVITLPVERLSNGHVTSPPPPDNTWKKSPLYQSSDSEDEDVPEMIKRLSDSTFLGQRSSDTLSSDIIVNSISTGTSLWNRSSIWGILIFLSLSLLLCRAWRSRAAVSFSSWGDPALQEGSQTLEEQIRTRTQSQVSNQLNHDMIECV